MAELKYKQELDKANQNVSYLNNQIQILQIKHSKSLSDLKLKDLGHVDVSASRKFCLDEVKEEDGPIVKSDLKGFDENISKDQDFVRANE